MLAVLILSSTAVLIAIILLVIILGGKGVRTFLFGISIGLPEHLLTNPNGWWRLGGLPATIVVPPFAFLFGWGVLLFGAYVGALTMAQRRIGRSNTDSEREKRIKRIHKLRQTF